MNPEMESNFRYKYIVSMGLEEASARSSIASETEGVEFECFSPEDAQDRGYRSGPTPPGKVIGVTFATDDDSLYRFNKRLKSIRPHKKFVG